PRRRRVTLVPYTTLFRSMRAAVVERYGPPEVVEIREVPTPAPGADEILVRIRAITVNSGDARVRALRVPGGMGPLMRLSLGWSGDRKSTRLNSSHVRSSY